MGKRQWKWRAIVVTLGLLWGNAVLADEAACPAADAEEGSEGLQLVSATSAHAPTVLYQEDDAEGSQPATPFEEEPEPAPLPDKAYDSPSDVPAAPPSAAQALAADEPDLLQEPLTDYGYAEVCGGGRRRPCKRSTCPRCSCAGRCATSRSCRTFTLGGWIDQGITVNGDFPTDRFNGPVTFNDRDGEYQLNQLWVYLEREVDTGGYGWDVGGRVDFMYGTDWRFTRANGLEDGWNSRRFYGAALPQLYLDVGVGDLTVRMGHFFTIIGYEVVPAPNNFFYSHAYATQYGEPFTHTGLLASYSLGDQWSLSGGFGRGWDNWEDNNSNLSFLGGVAWTSYNEDTSLAFALSTGDYNDAGGLNRTMYSLVFTRKLSHRLTYVMQHDLGIDNDAGLTYRTGRKDNGEWYGINQYLIYDLNECWSLGMRVEWFADDDGTRVGGIGAPNGWTLGPDVGPDTTGNRIGWAGDFKEITLGLNWKPCDDIVVRPECRWDWYQGPPDGAGRFPYNFGRSRNQFTFATDLIVTF